MVPSKVKKIVVLGSQGSGKDTQCVMLLGAIPGSKMLHMSDILKHYIETEPDMLEGEAWKLDAGELVSGRVGMRCLNKYVASSLDPAVTTVIFNGVPRGREQTKMFVEHFDKPALQTFMAVFLRIEREVAVARCVGRANVDFATKGRARTDDAPEILSRRLDLYFQDERFILSTLIQHGVKCLEIPATGSKEDVHRHIMSLI